MHRIIPFVLLFFFIANVSAFGARDGSCRRMGLRRNKSCAIVYCPSYPKETAHYCLQSLELEFPQPGGEVFGLYECLIYPSGCEGTEPPEGGLYYGPVVPEEELPQTCEDENCVSDGDWARRSYGSINGCPGHGKQLWTRTAAWSMVSSGLTAAGIDTTGMEYEFYKIPRQKSKVGRSVYMIVVKIPRTDATAGFRYLGVETQPLLPPLDAVDFPIPAIKVGPGAQLTIDYTAHGETRRANVWLKK